MAANRLKQSPLITSICLLLALGTLALYWPITHHKFITLDDNLYVTANPQVQAGLTWTGLKWAFTNTIASNWHPLTWLSHMLDCQCLGLNSGGHHMTNVLFHLANVLLLFAWLNSTTRAVWRSALVTALFAWHPLHVESVAWVAERKDVLSAFFWLLTLLAYTRYAKCLMRSEEQVTRDKSTGPAPSATFRPSLFYALALLFCAAALMSKPMAVTLPFVLLLVDLWPLGRIASCKFQVAGSNAPTFNLLVLEKLPFLALAVAVSGVNYIAQKSGGATWSSGVLPFPIRAANAVISYVRYLSKTFWPADLTVIYPYEEHWPLWFVLTSIALLLLWSGTVIWRTRKNPFLFFGWFYFVGTLIPTIGLVQVGPQAMADRYTYLPSIGLFVLVVWGINELLAAQARRKEIAALAGAAALCACLVTTSLQLQYWQNSVKLLLHAVEVTTGNYTANAYLGGALEEAGFNNEALPFYFESVRITPYFPHAQWSLGMALLRKGRPFEASEHLAAAAQLVPNDSVIRCYSGKAFADAGNLEAANTQFTAALRLKPDYAEAHAFLAVNLARQNKIAAAIPHFVAAAKLAPDRPDIRFNYGLALLNTQQPNEAAAQFREALTLQPDFPEAARELAAVLAAHPELK